MGKDPKVNSLQDIAKLCGVTKVVEATLKGQATKAEDVAEALAAVLIPDEGANGDLNALLKFKPSEFVKEGKKTAAILEDELKKLEALVEKLNGAKETLRKIRETNRKKSLFGNTPETRQLDAMIEAGEKAFDATDEETKSLYRFRRDHVALSALVGIGHTVFKALKKGEKPSEAVLKELSEGYADYLHSLLREGCIVEVPADLLRRWSEKRESFSDFASSWLYKDCRDHDRKFCTHWFWGVSGDEQSIRLARDLRNLNNVNALIRNFGKSPRPASARVAKTPTATAAEVAIVPDEPAGQTSGSTES